MVWVVLPILVIAIVVLAVLLMRSRRSERLQEDFGPEYERTLAERGDRRDAEAELAQRRDRRAVGLGPPSSVR